MENRQLAIENTSVKSASRSNGLAGNPVGLWTDQKSNQLRSVFRLTQPPKRVSRKQLLPRLLSHATGVGWPRIHRIHGDSVFPDLVRQGDGKGIQRSLRRAVSNRTSHGPYNLTGSN